MDEYDLPGHSQSEDTGLPKPEPEHLEWTANDPVDVGEKMATATQVVGRTSNSQRRTCFTRFGRLTLNVRAPVRRESSDKRGEQHHPWSRVCNRPR